MKILKSHRELEVYRDSYDLALNIFKLTKTFPKEEIYSLTNQIRRSSRSVPANITEGFRKRRYEKAFVSKLSDAETEAAETLVWLDFSKDLGYLNHQDHARLIKAYDAVIGKLVTMIHNSNKWTF